MKQLNGNKNVEAAARLIRDMMCECRTFEELAVALMGKGVLFPTEETLERENRLAEIEHRKFQRLRKRVLKALRCCEGDVKSCVGCPYDSADDCCIALHTDIKDLVWAFDKEYTKLVETVREMRKTSTLRFLGGKG